MVRAAYWATKLLPYAGCGRSAQCPWPVLLVTSRFLWHRGLLLRALLAIRILCAVLRILPAVGLVRHWTSLVVVIAAPCFGPAANRAARADRGKYRQAAGAVAEALMQRCAVAYPQFYVSLP